MSKQTLAVLTGLILVSAGIIVAIFFARGYQFDISKKSVTPTGILVATSDPDGAQVLIDGKLKTATNTTINLEPGTYSVKIQKEGFTSWEKKIEIKKEEVFKTNAFLFPALADLRPLTFNGVSSPSASPDGTKIIYNTTKGLYELDMGRSFLPSQFFSAGDARQILTDPTDEWKILAEKQQTERVAKLPIELKGFSAIFSPDESKILYTATASATLPKYLKTYLPGTNPTPEIRQLITEKTYVYDLKEDKNYIIENCKFQISNCVWFPSSRHILSINKNQISVMEFDGTNKAVLFNGEFDPKAVFPWPNWNKIVILTSLGATDGQTENLYTINLR